MGYGEESRSSGRSQGCRDSNDLCTITLNTNSNIPWHDSLGSPPSDRFDLYSVAAHEFGHWMGVGHSHDVAESHVVIVIVGKNHVPFKKGGSAEYRESLPGRPAGSEYPPGDFAETREVLYFGFMAAWTLRNGIAVSAVKGRTVPAEALIDRILAERKRGYVPTDLRGAIDPLQEEEVRP